MQLLFVWVRKYGIFEKQLFNFSNEYRFKVEERNNGNTMVLHIVKNADHIPGLWQKNITSITGIFGKNGSGKTTIMDYISSNIPDGAGILPDGLVLGTQHDGKYKVWVTDDQALWEKGDTRGGAESTFSWEKLGRTIGEMDLERRTTSIVYYTPSHWAFDDTKELVTSPAEDHGFYDISTSFLLRHDAISFANNDQVSNLSASGVSQVLAHRFESWKREMSFLASPHAACLDFPLPEYVNIATNQQEEHRLTEDNKFKDLLLFLSVEDNQINVVDLKRAFKDETYRAMIFNLFYTRKELSSWSAPNVPEVIANETIVVRCRRLLEGINEKADVSLRETAVAMLAFIDYMETLGDSFLKVTSRRSAKITVCLGESAELNVFWVKYSRTIVITDYLLFFWNRRLSSGEQSLLTLYARLWMLADKPDIPSRGPARNVRLQKDVILLLDEADAYFHPEWQKQLYKRLVDVLPKIFIGHKLQIILSANNPYQLSDMLRYQANFLNERGCVVQETDILRQTFAGNIHYLLSDSFFMGDSLLGDFAEEKIRELVNWLDPRTKNATPPKWLTEVVAVRLIEQIGEPILRDKLREMIVAKFPERFKVAMLKRRIHDLDTQRVELMRELDKTDSHDDQNTSQ